MQVAAGRTAREDARKLAVELKDVQTSLSYTSKQLDSERAAGGRTSLIF